MLRVTSETQSSLTLFVQGQTSSVGLDKGSADRALAPTDDVKRGRDSDVS